MKYVLLFCGDAEDAAAFQALSPDELAERYGEVGRWFQEHHAKILAAEESLGCRHRLTEATDWATRLVRIPFLPPSP